MSFSFDQINHTHTSPCLVGQTWVFRVDVRAKQCGRGVSRTCFFVTLPFFSMFLLFFLSFNYLKRRSWKRTHTHINTHTTQNNNNKKKSENDYAQAFSSRHLALRLVTQGDHTWWILRVFFFFFSVSVLPFFPSSFCTRNCHIDDRDFPFLFPFQLTYFNRWNHRDNRQTWFLYTPLFFL